MHSKAGKKKLAKPPAAATGRRGRVRKAPAGPTKPAGRRERKPAAAPIAHGPGLDVKPGRHLLFLSAAHLRKLPWEKGEAVNHAQIALRELGRCKSEEPPQIWVFPQRDSLLSAGVAYVPNVQACGLKWFASFSGNSRLSLPRVNSLVLLADPHTGFPLALLDAGWLLAQSGPAVSAVAARLLARSGATIATIIGAGVQGRAHIPVLAETLDSLRNIRICDIDQAAAESAAKWAREKSPRKIEIVCISDLHLAVRDADLIVSATGMPKQSSATVPADWIRSGALLLPLDTDAIFQPAVFEQADRVYVDSASNIHSPHVRGLLGSNNVGQLGQLLADEKVQGRGAPAERIVCLNVGSAAVQIVLARAVFEKACRLGVGQVLEL